MNFKTPALAEQFKERLHPLCAKIALRFDAFCLAKGYGPATVTAISREPEFYEENALETPRFSWHLVDCAVDFRNQHLTKPQRAACEAWFRAACPGSQWELVFKDHGTGPHFHIAYRDFSRRNGFSLTSPKEPK